MHFSSYPFVSLVSWDGAYGSMILPEEPEVFGYILGDQMLSQACFIDDKDILDVRLCGCVIAYCRSDKEKRQLTYMTAKVGWGVSNPLLWVDSKAMIKFAEDIDLFTLTELPKPTTDPY
ncbi:hypothetical protein Tco_0912093 [Tanacetum coccineum]